MGTCVRSGSEKVRRRGGEEGRRGGGEVDEEKEEWRRSGGGGAEWAEAARLRGGEGATTEERRLLRIRRGGARAIITRVTRVTRVTSSQARSSACHVTAATVSNGWRWLATVGSAPDEVECVPADGDERDKVHRQRNHREAHVAPEHLQRLRREVVEAQEADDRGELDVGQRDDGVEEDLRDQPATAGPTRGQPP